MSDNDMNQSTSGTSKGLKRKRMKRLMILSDSENDNVEEEENDDDDDDWVPDEKKIKKDIKPVIAKRVAKCDLNSGNMNCKVANAIKTKLPAKTGRKKRETKKIVKSKDNIVPCNSGLVRSTKTNQELVEVKIKKEIADDLLDVKKPLKIKQETVKENFIKNEFKEEMSDNLHNEFLAVGNLAADMVC